MHMMGLLAMCTLWSLMFLLAMWILVFVPVLGPVGESALAPGYWIPTAYWGGVHDPLQFLIANLLNLMFYALLFFACAQLRQRLRPSERREE
jgi:hypothetical protein